MVLCMYVMLGVVVRLSCDVRHAVLALEGAFSLWYSLTCVVALFVLSCQHNMSKLSDVHDC